MTTRVGCFPYTTLCTGRDQPEYLIASKSSFFRGYVTSKSLTNVQDFMFQLYCYVYLNLNMQKDIYLLSGKSQQIVVV